MKQLLEAAKKALEALESLQGGCTDSDDGTVEALTIWCPEVCEELRAAIEAAEQPQQIGQGVPDGWQLVPKEPTDAMVRAALRLDLSYMPGHDGPDRAAVYKAMLASSPPAPQQIGQGVPEEGDLLTIAYLHGFAKGKDAASAPPAPQQKPLLDEKKLEMWTNATIECCTHMACYMRGIEDAEAEHGIGEKK